VIPVIGRLFVAALAIFAVAVTYGAFRIWEHGTHDDRRPAGAVVVLGAAQYDGRPSPVFAARLDHAGDGGHAGLEGARHELGLEHLQTATHGLDGGADALERQRLPGREQLRLVGPEELAEVVRVHAIQHETGEPGSPLVSTSCAS
jgi:hypothetical protein